MTHLFDRILWAKDNLTPVQPKYCVVWEDPKQLDEPCKISTPAPEWLACALHGGILPPIETYIRDRETPDDAPKEHPYAEPIGPMSEEEAMEYLILKDVPPHVVAHKGNRPVLKIMRRDAIPKDRSQRNAWRLSNIAA